MNTNHKPSIFSHALKMLWRNKNSYALLTVTIVLSFSLLLGYLSFTDSDLYNRYKVIFSSRKDVVLAYSYNSDPTDHLALVTNAQHVDESTQFYHYFSIQTQLAQYQLINARAYFLPQGNRPVFEPILTGDDSNIYNITQQIQPILGKKDFNLTKNEAIVNRSFFEAISPDGTFPVSIVVPISWKDGTTSYYEVNVVGVTNDKSDCYLSHNENGKITGQIEIYLSQSLLQDHTAADFQATPCRVTWLSSSKPGEVSLHAKQLNLIVHSVNDAQEQALIKIQSQKATKGFITITLLVLLGINLYSSFSNALEHRKYEIGVKRAIGASNGNIMKQFLYEGIVVMFFNIIASIIIVTNALIVYKLYYQILNKSVWTVDVSVYSILMFLVCSVFLTIAFSLLFAFKTGVFFS